jgi:hypothetical protein
MGGETRRPPYLSTNTGSTRLKKRMNFCKNTIILAALLAVTACSSPKPEQRQVMLTPPSAVIDPSDAALRSAIQTYLASAKAPGFARYQYHRVDLNNDNRRDAVVILHTPYNQWCGQHGCTMVVMKASNTAFTPISTSAPVRTPIYLATTSTQGWRDIIVPVSGRMQGRKDVLITFNGAGYPASPENLRGISFNDNILMASENKIFP